MKNQENEKLWAVIKVGTLLEGDCAGDFVISVRQEPWAKHKEEEVRIFQSPNRVVIVQVAERLSELLRLNVYYSDRMTAQEFLSRGRDE